MDKKEIAWHLFEGKMEYRDEISAVEHPLVQSIDNAV